MLTSLSFVVAPAHFALAAWLTCHVLLTKRDVRAAIGWIGAIWLAPFLGDVLYVGFGISRVRRRARRLMGVGRAAAFPISGDISSSDSLERLKVAVSKITGEKLRDGRVVAVLNCGNEAYPRMVAAIDEAQLSIDLSSYIFRADEAGADFIAALVRAHERGVKVRVLIDGFGGGFIVSAAYHRLKAHGVPVARFLHSVLPWRMPLLDLRLHKKILVVDGKFGFIGGLNIGAENLSGSGKKPRVNDLHFLIEGPIMGQVAADFDDDWSFTTGDAPRDKDSLRDPAAGPGVARMIAAGPDQETDQLVLVLLSAVNLAQRSIKIVTPYFLPDEPLITALQLASLRGVSVDIVVPSENNHRLVAWAMGAHVAPLLETGCRVWRSPPPFDHTKLMTIDEKWSLVGSANWDSRSLRLNFEIAVEVYDQAFAEQLGGMIDQKCAGPLTLRELRARPLVVKLRDAAARLAMPYI
jgi:cardiolipin synthase A/B